MTHVHRLQWLALLGMPVLLAAGVHAQSADRLGTRGSMALEALTVDGLTGFHRDGQTFLTWNEALQPTLRYRVYRAAQPIESVADLDGAVYLGEVDSRSSQNRPRSAATGVPQNWIIQPGEGALADSQGLYVHTAASTEVATGHYAVMVSQNGIESRVLVPGQNTTSVGGEIAAPPQPVLQDLNGSVELWAHWTTHVNTPYQPALSLLPSHGHNIMLDPGTSSGPRGLLVRLHSAGQTYAIGWPHRFEVPADVDILALSDTYPGGSWTLWAGAQESYPKATTDPQAKVHLLTLKRVMWTVDRMVEYLGDGHDPDRLYAAGGSMGGMGAFYLGSEYPERFAAVLARNGNYDLTAHDINNKAFIETLLGSFDANLVIAGGVPSAGLRVYDRFNVSVRAPFPPDAPGPVIRTINGRFDTTVGWSSAPMLYRTLAAAWQPAVHYFDDREHNPFGYWMSAEPALLARTFATRRDRPSLHFGGLTLDDDPGAGAPLDGNPIGCLSCYVDYDLETASADESSCRFDVYLRRSGAFDDAPADSAEVVLTPGRTAPFAVQPGGTVVLTWSESADPSAVIDVQTLVADEHGRVHSDPVVVTTTPRRAVFTLGDPPAPPATPPAITSFDASPLSVPEGGTTRLTWTTTDATAVTLEPGTVVLAADGELVVGPSETTTYVLTATGPGGTDTATVTVTVTPTPEPPPAITSFTAEPAAIQAGETTTLTWATADADAVLLDGSTVALDGSLALAPAETTTYVLTATGPGGSDSATVTVTVTPAPEPAPTIASFAADPATIQLGETTTLTWATSDADLVELDGVGPVGLDGSLVLAPAQTTTYALTASGPGGSVTATLTVVVGNGLPMPFIESFTTSASTIVAGESATLTWATENTNVVNLGNGTGMLIGGPNDMLIVWPVVTTTYTLTATGPGGTTAPVMLTVTVLPAPSVAELEVDVTGLPGTVDKRDTHTMTVAITNAGGAASDELTVSVTTTGGGRVDLREPSASSQAVPAVEAGTSRQVTWDVYMERDGSVTLTVEVTDGAGAVVDTVVRTLDIQD